jgi:hypothetical protein
MVALCSAVEWENAASGSGAACPGDEAPSSPPMMGPLSYHASQGETTVSLQVVGASPTSLSGPSRRPTILPTCPKRRCRWVAPPRPTP